MKKAYWIIFFLLILSGDIAGIELQNETIESICKPLLMIILAGYFLSQTNEWAGNLKKWIVIALFFSWVGDVLLMFQQKNELFFMLGLAAFLLAHIFYIVFFHLVRLREGIKSNMWLLLIVVTYYAILISFLSPYLGKMKLPVRVYGIVISFMLMLAMHMLFMKNKKPGRWMVLGAFLFVISDSLLAINKFYQDIPLAGVLIMLTYGLAQLFIMEGAISYIRSATKR
jgi:uncharacterized membrane protein YhhN